MFDCIVVGASLAGSTFSYLMGGMGYSVALIDAARFPRAKACGEGIALQGAALLRELGVLNLERDLPCRPFNSYRVHPGNSKPYTIEAPGAGIGVERSLLDMALLERAARQRCVTVFQGQEVTAIDPERGEVHAADLQLKAKIIVLATGAGAEPGLSSQGSNSARFGLSFHLNGPEPVPTDGVTILITELGELICTPLANCRANISFLGHAGRSGSGIRKRVERELLPKLLDQLKWNGSIDYNSGTSGSTITQVRRSPILSSKVIRIGDACEQLDPIAGMGMTHAIASAQLAAQAVRQALEEGPLSDLAIRKYAAQREAYARALRGYTALTYATLIDWRNASFSTLLARPALASYLSRSVHMRQGAYRFGWSCLSLIGGLL